MTVTRLRREMPEAEYAEWIGFYVYEAKQREAAEKKARQASKRR